MSSILCENLKKVYPNSSIDYLIYEHTKAVVQNNPMIDNLILYQKKKTPLWKLMISIRKKKYDILIDAYGKTESNLISLFARAKIKISYYKWYTSWIYSSTVTRVKDSAIKGRLILLEPLNIETTIVQPTIYLSKKELQLAKDFLESYKINRSYPIFMMSILGSSEEKTYPLAYMAQVIKEIVLKTKATILFNYIPSQKEQVDTLYNLCDKEIQKYIHTEIYAPSLRDFLGLLTYCNALIGNEGGAVNMAKALRIPTFSIYSPNISKKSWNFLSDEKNVGVHLFDYQPDLKNKKLSNEELYKKFLFKYIEKELEEFLNISSS